MLPFLKPPKRDATVIVQDRNPAKDSQEDPGLIHCAVDLCHAIEAKDYKGIAQALRAAFTILDSEPHVEGEHTLEGEDTY